MPPRKQAPDIEAAIGRQIRRARLARGFTQTGLAKRLSITFQQVQKYENGSNRVAASTLGTIAQILDVPVAWFFGQAEAVPDRRGSPAAADG